jgi:hypothetical protein
MPSPGAGGDVMMSVPKAAFDAIHQVVMELSKSLDELAGGINQQAAQSDAAMGGGMGAGMEEMPEGEGLEGASPEDEEFLKGMMEEGNAKTR